MKNYFLFIITVLLAITSKEANAQNYADKNYYLVDSLVYENIAPEYQKLIDNCLEIYHNSSTDMDRITAVNQIVKLCWDENVWPKYNQWVYDYSRDKLKEPQVDSVRIQLKQALAGAIYYIGWNFSVQADYDNCISNYEKCKEIYIEIDDSIGIANSLDYIGNIYLIKGESAKALEYLSKALEIREKINDKLGTGASLISIGSIYMEHGDYRTAFVEFERALKLHDEVSFTSGVSISLNNLGIIQSFFGSYESALTYFQRSFKIKEVIGDKQGKGKSLSQIGMISLHIQDYSNALDYFQQSLSLFTEVGDKRGIAGSMCNIGSVFRLMGNYEEALNYFNQSLVIAKEIGSMHEKKSALEGLFYTRVSQGNLDEAENSILEIIAMLRNDVRINFPILPEKKKELYFSTMSEDFMNLYAFANIRKNENPSITEIAYNNALKLKGLLLKSNTAMREAILTSGDRLLIEEYNSWIHLKIQIAEQYAMNGETDSLEQIANEVEKEMIKKSNIFSEFSKSKDVEWKNVQEKLHPGEAAIEYIFFNSEIGNNDAQIYYAALVITADSKYPKMIDLCTANEIENLIGTTHANNLRYVEGLYGTQQKPNHDLYKLIWEPIEKELTGVNTIYMSASGLLHKISFSALCNEKNEFLCDKYKLSYLNSTSQLTLSKPFELSNNSVASLFGGVKYNTEKTESIIWTYLPGTLSEIDSIHLKIKDKIEVNYFSKEQASEENFKEIASQSNFIHIASHGFFYPDPELVQKEVYKYEHEENVEFRGGDGVNYGVWSFVINKNPLMRSGLVLAGANDVWQRSAMEEGEDGILTAQEVSNLDLRNTKLVVLSACETGLGDIKGSEGVYGLQRAFKMAGAEYLIMSLWQVPDKETAEFMELFYKNLVKVKDIPKAFGQTQMTMRKKYDPYYWAAFTLIE
jgi:CHAT domain-containing protein/tetratricopeptide (TPR) repeat protein